MYALTSPSGLLWREWDGEAVVYNEASGSTHRLPGAAADVLRTLEARPLAADALVAELAGLLPERREDVGQWVLALLERLEQVGLVERR